MLELMATCCPGLEDVLADEVAERLGAAARAARGQVRWAGEVPGALALRCADNLYAIIGEVPAGPHRADLPALGRALAALPVAEVCEAVGVVLAGRLHVSASRTGRHSYSRFEAADAARGALCAVLGLLPGTPDDHDVALRLALEGDRALLSLKLTDAAFRFRGERVFAAAAIRPTIAHAMVRLTVPGPADVFLDPFCGSGTLLAERLTLPHGAVLGGDKDGDTLAVAARNTGGQAALAQWDARALPLADASVDAIATNPPWGRQIAVEDSAALYHAFLGEALRVLRPGGRLVILTDRTDDLGAAAQAWGLALPAPRMVSLHGTLCGLWAAAKG